MSTSIDALSIPRITTEIKGKLQLTGVYIAMIVPCAGCAKTYYPIASTVKKLLGVERKVEPEFESYTTIVEQKWRAEEAKQKRIEEAVRQREVRQRQLTEQKRLGEEARPNPAPNARQKP
jgi:hypothetical protein